MGNNTGWVLHIVGPDDVIPQPDELTALREANIINKAAEWAHREHGDDPNWPYYIAIVRPADAPEVSGP